MKGELYNMEHIAQLRRKVYDWHPELTDVQKEELIAEGLKPGDAEYFHALRNYGIRDDGPFHYVDVRRRIVYDWHPELTEEQKEELIAEGIEPGDAEYFHALRNYGIRDDGPFHYEVDPEEEIEAGRGIKVYDWHPELTEEQKEELIAEGIEPGDAEYFHALRNYGIRDDGPFHYEEVEEKKLIPKRIPVPGPKKPTPGPGKPTKGPEPTPEPIPVPVPPPPGPTPEPTAIAKSGLQIFREQFNNMPDIKNKHTLSERLQAVQAIGGAAGVTVLAFNPVIGILVAGGALASKPIAYRLTGQKKLEKEIEAQFLDMDPKEFDKMVDYLSEEKIQDIKPNACILRALHQAMLKRTREKSVALDEEVAALSAERDALLAKSDVTPDENTRLGEITTRLVQIEEVEAPQTERRLKDVKRGKDRVSMMYKGNLATRFNIFAHRNTSSKEYSKPINELADAEYNRDISRAEGNHAEAARYHREMDNVMTKYTSTNGLGVQNSVFNKRGSIARIMSDKLDNTLKYMAMLTTAGVGATLSMRKLQEFEAAQGINQAEHTRIVNEYNTGIDGVNRVRSEINSINSDPVIDSNSARVLMDGQVRQVADMGEVAAVRTTGVTTTSQYRDLDRLANERAGQAMTDSTLTGNDPAGLFEQLAKHFRTHGSPAAKDLETIAQAKMGSHVGTVDHTAQLQAQSAATQQVEAQAKLYEGLGKLYGKLESLKQIQIPGGAKLTDKFEVVKQSFMGPIISGLGTVMGVGKSMTDNRKEAQHNRAANTAEER